MAKLTVTIPHYKQLPMLQRALRALQDQTFKDFRIVILDDASDEDYSEILALFSNLDISIERNPVNLGGMRNILKSILYETESPYIVSAHADDFLKTNYLEHAVGLLDKDTQLSFVATSPDWVHRDTPYRKENLKHTKYEVFDAPELVYKILHFKPIMWSGVVYRREHLISDLRFDTYDLYCDRYFLTTILKIQTTKGALLTGRGIFERDHARDPEAGREANHEKYEPSMIAILIFYKEILEEKYAPEVVTKLITNNTLYYYSTLPREDRSRFSTFYREQRQKQLIDPSYIRLLGVYALLTLPLSWKQQQYARKIAKAILHPS
jgi:glycosyltransferase involved in cell wall biosynthesis